MSPDTPQPQDEGRLNADTTYPYTKPEPVCTHERTIRKFGGAVLCADCDAEVGDWRVEEGATRG